MSQTGKYQGSMQAHSTLRTVQGRAEEALKRGQANTAVP